MAKKRVKSKLRKRYEELLDVSREAICELMSDWDENLKTLHKDYAPGVSMTTMYHFMEGQNTGTIHVLLGGICFRETLNTLLGYINTTIRALLTVYNKTELADLLNMDRRSIFRMCNTQILRTRKLIPFLENIDSTVNGLSSDKYCKFELAKKDIIPAFTLGGDLR